MVSCLSKRLSYLCKYVSWPITVTTIRIFFMSKLKIHLFVTLESNQDPDPHWFGSLNADPAPHWNQYGSTTLLFSIRYNLSFHKFSIQYLISEKQLCFLREWKNVAARVFHSYFKLTILFANRITRLPIRVLSSCFPLPTKFNFHFMTSVPYVQFVI